MHPGSYLYKALKTFRTILTGILAALLLISSITHSVSLHICGGEVKSIAFFGRAQMCEEHAPDCDHDTSHSNHPSIGYKECCEDATVVLDAGKYSIKANETFTSQTLTAVLPLMGDSKVKMSYMGVVRRHFLNYRPPLIKRDITLLVQTFLI